MKRKLYGIIALFLAVLVFAVGCSQKTGDKENGESTSPNLLNAEWDEVLTESKGQTVNMYMWGGGDTINRYIDEWVAPRLKEETGVTLKRIPMNDTKDIINQLLDEKQVGKESGSMDVIWINGENFKTAKENGLLWGSFIDQLPNYNQFIDKDAPDINKDFGEDINSLEAPWGKAQFVFVYDQDKVKNPPKSMEDLNKWVKKNPGKFTYPAPPDFTGSAFVRHALYETTGGYEQYLKSIGDKKNLDETVEPLWDYLNDLEPYLWREGKTYPESLAKLDQLYANGEVWMTMGYDPARASAEIQKGLFPESTRSFVLDGGTLSNTHYLSIPFNSSHKAGAMAAINFMLSPDAQIAKLDPKYWGDLMAIDLNKLSEEDQKRVSEVELGTATLPADVLSNHRLPEIPAPYVDVIEKGWMEHVAKE
jgi:putative spermidine/putrescine transport system substrate-binding protein